MNDKYNKAIYIKYKNGKGIITERLVSDLVTSFELHNTVQRWIIRCICCTTNKSLVMPLQGVTFLL